MSFNLWKFFIEDDVDSFRQYLARATYVQGSSRGTAASLAGPAVKIGSPGTLATSPRTPTKSRKSAGSAQQPGTGRFTGLVLTRADINARDSSGRTILHHAASSSSPNASCFVRALLDIPALDLYIQDTENGWTALHRALYYGNIDIAQALLLRDTLDATDFSSTVRPQVGGLVKIKDNEGNSPFEVFALTIAPRDLSDPSETNRSEWIDHEDTNSVDVREDSNESDRDLRQMQPRVNLRGDEAFAFGSNKNLSLGLGDEGDRQFPERISLERPEQLQWRLCEDHRTRRSQISGVEDMANSIASLHRSDALPALIKYKPIKIQNIVMAKLHTAILTDDPVLNLHICGFGAGGRLGTGDEITRFKYVCVQGGGLASRRVSSIALGQDHSVAICSSGEVFTWGSNKYGQLGYVLPEVSSKEVPTQLTPRQVYGLVKKETIIGAAASTIHSVIYTASGLYTFGKNEGQLGLMDADARSLKIQEIPRRVGVSIMQSPIVTVSAIDRATTVLLENHDVIVFTHYGFTKVVFPLEESNIFLAQSLPTNYIKEANAICKITSGGNTIGALSTFGQVFTVDVPKAQETVSSNVSTTNPNKARNALPIPHRDWSIRKSHMSAVDFAVGQDGSIILCTETGSVWRKEKRANIKSVHSKGGDTSRTKDYKFVRVPNLTRATAVRSNAFGAFTAVRRDCDVTREQMFIDPPALQENLFPLLSFHDYRKSNRSGLEGQSTELELRFWLPKKVPGPASIKDAILKNVITEEDFIHLSRRFEPLAESQYDAWITSSVSDIRIPVHSVMLKARSRVLRSALSNLGETYYFSIPDVVSVEYGQGGDVEVSFLGADFLTLVNIALYVYSETLVDIWHYTSKALHLAPKYRQVRVELMKIASSLELRCLERAVRVMVDPTPCMMEDFEHAFMDLDFYSDADVIIDLAEDAERPAHSFLLSARCPFFEGLFHGRAAGKWLSARKHSSDRTTKSTHVDLKHVDASIFDMVQRHIYADTGDELFDDLVSKDLDGFVDTVIEVMSVANELMLDRLVQVCQSVIGKFVTPRNICALLNTVAECSVEEFKKTALEYVCLNLEGILTQRLLEDLDQYLLEELDEMVQDNQLAYMPISRSGRAQAELLDRHPHLAEQIAQSRQRRIDSMRLRSRLVEDDERPIPKIRVGSYDKLSSSPTMVRKLESHAREEASPKSSPAILPRDNGEELPFDMDEDHAQHLPKSPAENLLPPSSQIDDAADGRVSHDMLGTSGLSRDDSSINNLRYERRDLRTLSKGLESQSPVSETVVNGFDLPKAAWKNPVHLEPKMDLREIMEQASTSRVSHLTQAMNDVGPSKVPIHKMSQRERKRQQHQSKAQVETSKEPAAVPSVVPQSPQSPWTKVKSNQRTSTDPAPTEVSVSSSTPRPSPRPNLTVRQTVSGAPSSSKETPVKPSHSTPSIATTPTTAATPPQIQSIRHTPLTARSSSFVDAYTSMADILAQQQGEKVAIKEAGARRSLQEIQQEQEFQEWWDQESRRVQEASQSSVAATTRSEKAGRGRSTRRRGSGRGGASSTPDHKDKKSSSRISPSTADDSRPVRGSKEKHGGEVQGRGQGRGRGKGRSRQEQAAGAAAGAAKDSVN